MNEVGSLEDLKKGKTTGFIGYPRSYEVGPTPDKSFISGVDQAGNEFTLELRIPQRFIDAAKNKTDVSIPEVASMAETHRKARNPCYAGTQNGPGQDAVGVFLAEQVTVVDADKNLYAASWLSILQEDASSPKMKTGLGYLEINGYAKATAESEGIKLKLMQMNKAYEDAIQKNPNVEQIMGMPVMDFTQERDRLAVEFYNLQTSWFIGVQVQYDKITALDVVDKQQTTKQLIDAINENSHSGMYGGVILRPIQVRDGVRVVDVSAVRRINHQYDYKQGIVPAVEQCVGEFFAKGGGNRWLADMKSKGYEVEIIPCSRVNCGKITNEKYAKELKRGFSKQLKAFVDGKFHHSPYVDFARQNAHLVSPIAMRNAETRKAEFNSNYLLSSIHSFGKVVGNALEIDKNGERTLKLSSQPRPYAKPPQSENSYDR